MYYLYIQFLKCSFVLIFTSVVTASDITTIPMTIF